MSIFFWHRYFDTGTFVKNDVFTWIYTKIIVLRLYMTSTDIFEAKNTSFNCLSCNFDMVPVSDKCQISFFWHLSDWHLSENYVNIGISCTNSSSSDDSEAICRRSISNAAPISTFHRDQFHHSKLCKGEKKVITFSPLLRNQ